jgi:phosphonate metabolism transcriptional regulator PhnF
MDEFVMKPHDPGQIRRHDGVALWRQIATTLQERIGAGTYAPGKQLPTEGELSRGFAVNRHTVRRALQELSRGGLIRIEQGRGSFVAEDVIDYTVQPRTRFSEWIRRHNKEPSGRVLRLTEMAAPAQVAAGLGIRTGAKVVVLERLGLADDRPVSLGSHHFPATRFRGLLDDIDDYRSAAACRCERLHATGDARQRPLADAGGGDIAADDAYTAVVGDRERERRSGWRDH